MMGRADVLLRFLQLTGLDTPDALDHFLATVPAQDVGIPMVERVLEVILAENPNLVPMYTQARREAERINPYSSSDEREASAYDEAFTDFVDAWIQLENLLRHVIQSTVGDNSVSVGSYATEAQMSSMLTRDDLTLLRSVRTFRNRLLHSAERTSVDELTEARMSTNILMTRLGTILGNPRSDPPHR